MNKAKELYDYIKKHKNEKSFFYRRVTMNLEQLKSELIERNPELEKMLNSKEYYNGRVVFQRRMELGLTQQELSFRAGVTQKNN